MLDGTWHSLFPFVEGRTPVYGALSDRTVQSLGKLLGYVHRVGSQVSPDSYRTIPLWNKQEFLFELIELQSILERRAYSKHPVDPRVAENLKRKETFVRSNSIAPHDIPLVFDTLIHCDFIYQNTFVDEQGEITHIYDFEKTSYAPRAYELARSLLINCFDDGWEEKNFVQGRLFLAVYRDVYPIDLETFYHGVRMYLIHCAHMIWLDVRHIMTEYERSMQIYLSHARRVSHVGDDHLAFCKKLYR